MSSIGNSTLPANPWMSLATDAMDLALESHDVIGLRLARAASGRFDACDEAVRMVVEKAFAAWDTAAVVAECLALGEPHRGAERTIALYRRRVRANRSRLCGEAAQ